MAPSKDASITNSAVPVRTSNTPTPPPPPPVKVPRETRRQLPKLDFADRTTDEEDEEKVEGTEGIKSPFTRMIEEMEEYNGTLSSPTEHPVSKKSKGLGYVLSSVLYVNLLPFPTFSCVHSRVQNHQIYQKLRPL